MRDSMSDSRRSCPSRFAISTSSASPTRVAVIVVDVLEIVDVEEGQRECRPRVVLRQQLVDAVLDHPPRSAGRSARRNRPSGTAWSSNAFCSVMSAEVEISRSRPAMRTGRWVVRNTCLPAPPRDGLFHHGRGAPVRSSSAAVSRRSLHLQADGVFAAASQQGGRGIVRRAADSPCSSCTVTPEGSILKTSRRMLSSESDLPSSPAGVVPPEGHICWDCTWTRSLAKSLVVLVKWKPRKHGDKRASATFRAYRGDRH